RHYRPTEPDLTGSGSTRFTRRETTLSGAHLVADPETIDAAAFERRIETSSQHGGFLCLVAHPKALPRVRDELTLRFGAHATSIDRVLIHHLRLAAARRGASWDTVVGADAARPDSVDWNNL